MISFSISNIIDIFQLEIMDEFCDFFDPDNVIRYYTNWLRKLNLISTYTEFLSKNYDLIDIAVNQKENERMDVDELSIFRSNLSTDLNSRNSSLEEWAEAHCNLASAYLQSIKGHLCDNIEKSIYHSKLALIIFSLDDYPEDWALIHNNLASAYIDRKKGIKANNIENAINHCNLALDVRTRKKSPEQWARTHDNLAIAYRERKYDNPIENIENSIHHANLALEVFTIKNSAKDWAKAQNNLANAYRERFIEDRAENIDKSIYHLFLALEVFTQEIFPEYWALTHSNLALAYSDRIKGNRDDNIEEAINHSNLALLIYSQHTHSEKWAIIQNNLAKSYLYRKKFDHQQNIENAEHYSELALSIFNQNSYPQEWAIAMKNLAIAYTKKTDEKNAPNIEKSIKCYSCILEVYTKDKYPIDWAITQLNLGIAFNNRIQGDPLDNNKCAIICFYRALEIYTKDCFPVDYRKTLNLIGNSHFKINKWEEACSAYQKASEAGDQLLIEAFTDAGRQNEIWETEGLYSNWAFCLHKLGRISEAFYIFEKGKTRILNETLAILNLDPKIESSNKIHRFLEVRKQLHDIEELIRINPVKDAYQYNINQYDNLKSARNNLQSLVQEIGQEDPTFLWTDPDIRTILRSIPKGGALVSPIITSQGGIVFIIPSDSSEILPEYVHEFNDFDTSALNKLIFCKSDQNGWLTSYALYKKARKEKSDNIDQELIRWKKTIEIVLQKTWDLLMGPIYSCLQKLDLNHGAPIIIIPPGLLKLIPLHAAYGFVDGERRALIDSFTVSYIPSMTSLNLLKRNLSHTISKENDILLIKPRNDDLIHSQYECDAIASQFELGKSKILLDDQATKSKVRENACGKKYLHFSTHGEFGWKDVMKSGLALSDGTLTLADILSLFEINTVQMVTLSACETGIPEFEKIPDEYIGLSAGFIISGASCVVSSLWAVNEIATNILMEKLYTFHLKDGLNPNEALRKAQMYVRELTNDEIITYIRNSSTRFNKGLEGNKSISDLNDIQPKYLHYDDEIDLDNYPSKQFSDPYYWAGFVIYGL